jgi:hypothetical protein
VQYFVRNTVKIRVYFPSGHYYLINMFLKYTVLLAWVIYLSCKMILTGCKVVLVNRNVRDSFRAGKDGCKNDATVCTSSATCQFDGSCLCSVDEPNFRNPRTRAGDDKGYGCLNSKSIRAGAGECLYT